MITVLVRTVIVYVFLIVFMKLMGKRQVGELEISELVSALLLSELAAIPIEDTDIPLSNAAVPLLTIISLEIILSFCATKSNWLKRFLAGKPSILIERGKLNISELSRSRLSVEELLSELRLKGVCEFGEVGYAILEQNGQISVIPKKQHAPITPSDTTLEVKECGISHAIIVDGHIKKANLHSSHKSQQWLDNYLDELDASPKDIFLLTVNDCGKTNVIYKKENK